jgi:HD-GYP domain-containing protein (c-di-GMP phosphodiesterase class II)
VAARSTTPRPRISAGPHGSWLSVIAEIIRQHHERYDGRGYPAKLVGSDILIEARILAVCDSWAATRSDRPYQAARSEDQAREQLRLGRGTQFDPDVVAGLSSNA